MSACVCRGRRVPKLLGQSHLCLSVRSAQMPIRVLHDGPVLLATFKKKKVFFIFSERFASVFDLEYSIQVWHPIQEIDSHASIPTHSEKTRNVAIFFLYSTSTCSSTIIAKKKKSSSSTRYTSVDANQCFEILHALIN